MLNVSSSSAALIGNKFHKIFQQPQMLKSCSLPFTIHGQHIHRSQRSDFHTPSSRNCLFLFWLPAGESVSVIKHTDPVPDPRAVNQDKKNMLFSVSDCNVLRKADLFLITLTSIDPLSLPGYSRHLSGCLTLQGRNNFQSKATGLPCGFPLF